MHNAGGTGDHKHGDLKPASVHEETALLARRFRPDGVERTRDRCEQLGGGSRRRGAGTRLIGPLEGAQERQLLGPD